MNWPGFNPPSIALKSIFFSYKKSEEPKIKIMRIQIKFKMGSFLFF